MNKSAIFFAALCLASCSTHYAVDGVTRERLLVDSRYDAKPDADAAAFLAPYKEKVDSQMAPVVGHTVKAMKGYRPESPLSNLLADVLVWAAKDFGEQPVMGVYNMGGIRASLPEGAVTVGDVLDVAPFENKICFLTLSGAALTRLFENMASVGGEGVSAGVKLEISKDGKLLSAKLHGKEIDPAASYRITTIDYLAQGNDRMTAFKEKTDFVSPRAKENDSRFIIGAYFREKEKMGEKVDANIEGRITVKQ